MKNKKLGFTLAELLGVIVILGVITLIATVGINSSMKKSKEELYELQIDNIIRGAKNWASGNVFELPENDGEEIYLTLQELKAAGFVEQDITNPLTNELFSDQLQVKITKVDNNYNYEIVE